MEKTAKVRTDTDKMISLLRNSVFIINAFFTVIAACVFIIGTNVSSKYSNYESFLNAYHTRPVQMLTVAGIISTCLAILGMLGAAKYNARCLNMQNAFLFALLLVELAVISTGAFVLSDIKAPIQAKMLQSIPKFETQEKVRNAWNNVQEDFRCCGVNSPNDWYHPIPIGVNNGSTLNNNVLFKKIPFSCCNSYNCSSGNLFQHGCVVHVVDYVFSSMKIITFVPVAVMLLQGILIVLSCILLKYIRRNKRSLKEEKEYRIRGNHPVSFFISSTSLLDRSRM